jgi:hypothetical protein
MASCKRYGNPLSFDDDFVSERSGAKIPLESNTNEPHNCESEYFFDSRSQLKCSYCKTSIFFDDDYVSRYSGKEIPLDAETERPHDCSERRKGRSNTRCMNCGERIYFHPDYTSTNGKLIPMSVESGETHCCSTK